MIHWLNKKDPSLDLIILSNNEGPIDSDAWLAGFIDSDACLAGFIDADGYFQVRTYHTRLCCSL